MKAKIWVRPVWAIDETEYTNIYALVDWSLLETHWKADVHPGKPDRTKLTGYLKRWFHEERFSPPQIWMCPKTKSIDFINGRHRLAFITKHQNEVPIILTDQTILVPEMYRAVRKILTPDDYVDLPDVKFVDPS